MRPTANPTVSSPRHLPPHPSSHCQQDCILTEAVYCLDRDTLPLFHCLGPLSLCLLLACTLIIMFFSRNRLQRFFFSLSPCIYLTSHKRSRHHFIDSEVSCKNSEAGRWCPHSRGGVSQSEYDSTEPHVSSGTFLGNHSSSDLLFLCPIVPCGYCLVWWLPISDPLIHFYWQHITPLVPNLLFWLVTLNHHTSASSAPSGAFHLTSVVF